MGTKFATFFYGAEFQWLAVLFALSAGGVRYQRFSELSPHRRPDVTPRNGGPELSLALSLPEF